MRLIVAAVVIVSGKGLHQLNHTNLHFHMLHQYPFEPSNC